MGGSIGSAGLPGPHGDVDNPALVDQRHYAGGRGDAHRGQVQLEGQLVVEPYEWKLSKVTAFMILSEH